MSEERKKTKEGLIHRDFYYLNSYPTDIDKASHMASKVHRDLIPFSNYIKNSIDSLKDAAKIKAECFKVEHRLLLSPCDTLLKIKASDTVSVMLPKDNYYYFEWNDDWGSSDDFDELAKGRNTIIKSGSVIDIYNGYMVFKSALDLDTKDTYMLWTKNEMDYKCSISRVDYSKINTYRIESGSASFVNAYKNGEYISYQHAGAVEKTIRFFNSVEVKIQGTSAISIKESELKMDNGIRVEPWKYNDSFAIAHCDDEDVKKLYVNGNEVSYDIVTKEELCSLLNDERIEFKDKKIELNDRSLGNVKEKISIKDIKFTIKDSLGGLNYKFKDNSIYVELQEDEEFKNDIYSNISHFFKETTEFVIDEKGNRYKIGSGSEKFSQIEIAWVDKRGKFLGKIKQIPSELYVEPNTRQLRMQQNALNVLLNKPCKEHTPLLELMQDKTRAKWGSVPYQAERITSWYRLTDSKYEGCESQREFVKKALATPDFAILEGPPGGGKTTTILELIAQAIMDGKRVMLSASTNAAVDNILERLDDLPEEVRKKILAVRIGNDNAISESVDQYKVSSIEDEDVKNEIIRRANLVCGTIIGILQHPEFKLEKREQQVVPLYDYLIVDEASKTTFQEFLVPAVYAKKWILSGDLRQLTPYIEQDSIASSLKQISSFNENDQSAQAIMMTLENYVYAKKENEKFKFVIPLNHNTIKSLTKILPDYPKRRVALICNQINDKNALTASEFLSGDIKACMVHGADIVFCDSRDYEKVEQYLPSYFIPLLSNKDSIMTYHNSGYYNNRFPIMKLPNSEIRSVMDAKDSIDKELREKSWADEIAWRLCRIQELFLLSEMGNDGMRNKYKEDIKKRIPEFARDDVEKTISLLTEIALPSIIQLLQKGVSDKNIVVNRNKTTLNSGFDDVLRDRHTLVEYQHRMHDDISAFSAKHIYAGKALKNGKRINREWSYNRYPKRAYWLEVNGKESRNNNNPEEAQAIKEEIKSFIEFAQSNPKSNGEPWTVACLTYYRKQEERLKREVQKLLKSERVSSYQCTKDGKVEIMIYTVDKFQGKEADLVFLSMIKSGSAGLGFMDSPNRLNVALTRAKYQIVLVGNREYFRSNRCKSELLRKVAEEY